MLLAIAGATGGCGSDAPSHRPFPFVPIGDGALLSPAGLVTIVPANEPGAQQLFAFSAGVGASQWWATIAAAYGLTTVTPLANITAPALTVDVTDHDVYDIITAAVAQNGGPERNGNTIYMLYLPAGVRVIERGEVNADCQKFGGYHARYGTRGDQLVVVQQCFTDYAIQNMTAVGSHEIVEASTDADGNGYVLPNIAQRRPWEEPIWNAFDLTGHAELADLCEGTFYLEDSTVYQRSWSNAAAAHGGDPCIPRIADPFYDTTFDKDWYPIDPGGTVSIPVHGWATGPVASFPVKASAQSDTTGFDVTVADASIAPGYGTVAKVSAPAGATSGAFAVINVWSERPTPVPNQPGFMDGGHRNLVGVYVP